MSMGFGVALCDQKQGEVACACPHVKNQNEFAAMRPPHAGRSSREWFKNTTPTRHLILWLGIVSCNPLGIGELDGDRDRSVFGVASSVWIDDSGLVFVGSMAIECGEKNAIDGRRQRLDSLKQLISQATSIDVLTHNTLSIAENPTAYPVTPDDAVSIYLGYLTDLATTALDGKSSRYVRRRFSLPCWPKTHRNWSAPYMARLFGRAQLVADTFRGRWRQGIPVDECLAVLAAARKHDDDSLQWGGGSFHEAQLRRRRQEQQRPRDRLVVQV